MSLLELRTELEANWKERVKEARIAYGNASERALEAVENCASGIDPDAIHKLQEASHIQADARVELSRVLKIFTDLTARGIMPKE